MVQKQITSDLIVRLPADRELDQPLRDARPGDIIYTGTPGSTKKMSQGDVVEVEIEGIGVLRNTVA